MSFKFQRQFQDEWEVWCACICVITFYTLWLSLTFFMAVSVCGRDGLVIVVWRVAVVDLVSVCGLAVDAGHVDGDVVTTEYVHALTGATVELRCSELLAVSRHSGVRWLRDGVQLTDAQPAAGRFHFRSDDALDIVDVQLDDAAQYTCLGDGQRKHFVVQVIGRSCPAWLQRRRVSD